MQLSPLLPQATRRIYLSGRHVGIDLDLARDCHLRYWAARAQLEDYGWAHGRALHAAASVVVAEEIVQSPYRTAGANLGAK